VTFRRGEGMHAALLALVLRSPLLCYDRLFRLLVLVEFAGFGAGESYEFRRGNVRVE